ncbi:hypothetical protein BKA70DRAFT_1447512 [Coprinopsis sp. MPI-PUGE-AT-0042]|nr:hypothetical protein BKA70DRAFT_1447512 [Coprinopsis sp. MPI-PUGE-AT-0042]
MVFSAILFASTVKRHPIWFNFCLSFIVFSLSYSLLAFAPGQQGRDGVCIAQAAMVYAVPFLWVSLAPSASLALVALLLMNILSALSTSVKKRYPMTLTIALAGPWILWAAVLTGAVVFIFRDRSVVALSDNGTYCIVTRSPLPRLAAISSAVFAVGILILEIIIASLLYRHRAIKDVFSQSISMAIRIFIFTAVAVTAAVAGLIFACTDRRGVVFDVMIAIVRRQQPSSLALKWYLTLFSGISHYEIPRQGASLVDPRMTLGGPWSSPVFTGCPGSSLAHRALPVCLLTWSFPGYTGECPGENISLDVCWRAWVITG